ncbi:MAG: ATP-binding protein [Chloroflexi bacterium]|nr:ATP-binding protein [Chloroflexota bacterium]MCI0644104.1 ATP-binding protein [Chloroflexota bacterium]MCI0730683.1 ATP-binding protein [Chloroflexota bacterium]
MLVIVGQKIKTLQETQPDQTRALVSELIVAEQKVQQRISQVLHDDLQQILYGIQVQVHLLLKGLPSSEAESALIEEARQMAQMVDQAIRVTRQLTTTLAPPVLNDPNLVHSLEWLMVHVGSMYNLEVGLEVPDRIYVKDDGLRILLFQLVRELLFNVVKHAGVGRARLAAHEAKGGLVIMVADEGAGFDPAVLMNGQSYPGGVGLRSLQERVRLFDGRLKIESSPGRGTCITVTIPRQASIPLERREGV